MLNLGQLCTLVGQRISMDTTAGTRDGNAIRAAASLRHDQLYRSFLWKNSVIEMELNTNPANVYLPNSNYMPTKGRVILPPIFAHVLGVNYGRRSLNVQRQMLYYRANYRGFFSDCSWTSEFYLLSSCVWEFDIPLLTALTITNAADQGAAANVDYLAADEVSIPRLSVVPMFGAGIVNSVNIATTDIIDNATKNISQGQYQLQVFNYGVTVRNLAPGPVTFTVWDYTVATAPVQTTFTLAQFAVSAFVPGLIGRIDYNDPGEGLSGSMSTAPGYINGLESYNNGMFTDAVQPFAVSIMQPADMSAVKCQRLQLVGKPSTTIQQNCNLHILGKRVTPPFAADTDVPGVNGLDGVLAALLYYDMALRDERGGTPDAEGALREAVGPSFLTSGKPGGFLAKLIEEEVIQEATNSRIIPDSGFGGCDYFDEPYGSKGSPYNY